jgi:hypothetical protein
LAEASETLENLAGRFVLQGFPTRNCGGINSRFSAGVMPSHWVALHHLVLHNMGNEQQTCGEWNISAHCPFVRQEALSGATCLKKF